MSMDSTPESAPAIPAHIQNTVESIADLHAEHYSSLPSSQLGIEWLTARLGRPYWVFAVFTGIVLWLGINEWLASRGYHALDSAPFTGFHVVLAASALLMTFLILTTANRQDMLAERRAQLTLQIALLSETKITKVIDLVERIRSEHPLLSGPADSETATMRAPTDPKTVLDTMDAAQRTALSSR